MAGQNSAGQKKRQSRAARSWLPAVLLKRKRKTVNRRRTPVQEISNRRRSRTKLRLLDRKTGHEGWHTFGSGSGQGASASRSSANQSSANQPGGTEAGGSHQPATSGANSGQTSTTNSGGHDGWQKFPPNRGQVEENKTANPSRTDGSAHPAGSPEEHSTTPSNTAKPPTSGNAGSQNGGGWQKFPANSDTSHGSHADSSKPPLTIDRPIVTPRNSGSEPRSNPTPQPRMGTEPHSMPSPMPSAHSESHSAPPSRGESHPSGGHESHSGGSSGGSHSSGGSEKGSSPHSGKN